MSTEDPRDLIGAFVLGACSPEEHAQVRAHMKVDASFRAEVESFDVVHDALLEVPAADAAPGAGLKRSVMEQVQAEASLFAAAGTGERAAIVDERSAAGTSASIGDAPRGAGVPEPSPRRAVFLSTLTNPARAMALAAVLVALIVGGVVLSGGGDDTPAPVQVAGQFTDPANAKQATVKMVAADGTHRLEINGFKSAGAGKRYQVWLRSGDAAPAPTRVLFDVDARGNATAEVPGDMTDVDDVLVTAEPAGGSQTPTSEPVLHVQI